MLKHSKIIKKLKYLAILLFTPLAILPAAFAVSTATTAHASTAPFENELIPIILNNVIDGDTIRGRPKTALTTTTTSYRIQGIDTPEPFDSRNNFAPTLGLQNLYAKRASEYAKDFLASKNLSIIFTEKDKYDRSVVRIIADGIDFSLAMVKAGMARVFYISTSPNSQYYTPDSDYVTALYIAQWSAYQAKIGIWENPDSFTAIYPF